MFIGRHSLHLLCLVPCSVLLSGVMRWFKRIELHLTVTILSLPSIFSVSWFPRRIKYEVAIFIKCLNLESLFWHEMRLQASDSVHADNGFEQFRWLSPGAFPFFSWQRDIMLIKSLGTFLGSYEPCVFSRSSSRQWNTYSDSPFLCL